LMISLAVVAMCCICGHVLYNWAMQIQAAIARARAREGLAASSDRKS
jgi:hypothetical protein